MFARKNFVEEIMLIKYKGPKSLYIAGIFLMFALSNELINRNLFNAIPGYIASAG
jgi:hypothetical protein